MLRIPTSLILLLGLCFSCAQHNDTDYKEIQSLKAKEIDLNTYLDTYDDYVSKYPALFQKALYGDKKALKEYSDLMLDIAKIERKINELTNNNKLPSKQLKKYKSLKRKLTL